MLEELSEIAPAAGKNHVLREMNEQTRRYERIMLDLFPIFPLVKSAGGEKLLFSNAYGFQRLESPHWYNDFPETPELRMGSRIDIGSEVKNVDLRVLMPPNAGKEGYFMSVVVGGDYRRSCIDDLVAKLGEREKPELKGFQQIKNKPPVNDEYGIAEVPQLKTVLKLYDRADYLLRQAGDTIKITSEELRTLRTDMLKHPNIALRNLSAAEYQKALEVLTDQ